MMRRVGYELVTVWKLRLATARSSSGFEVLSTAIMFGLVCTKRMKTIREPWVGS